MRKFAIFSSSLIFEEKQFFNGSPGCKSTEQRIFETLEYTKKKGTEEVK